jgi:histidine ammonia-lyase
MATHSEPIYGINTGFGSLCNVKISNENLSKLQENLVNRMLAARGRSAKGNRQTDALKIQSLGYGHSGIQTVNRLSLFLMIFYLLFIHKVH